MLSRALTGSVLLLCTIFLAIFVGETHARAWPDPNFNLDPTVPLTHCALFGRTGQFMLEWELSLDPKNFLQLRYTSDIQRGFSAFGFTERDSISLLSGYPVEQQACAQHLFDNYSPFDINGNLHPNFPELPGRNVVTNASHVQHYIMRNISLTAAKMVEQGTSMPTNITIMWAYMQSSLFNGACYMDDLNDMAEYATYQILLNDASYLKTNGVCKKHLDVPVSHRYFKNLDHGYGGKMLDGEYHQNKRVAAMLFGGGLLLETGRKAPVFTGRVTAGENRNGACSNSLSFLYAGWSGFTDKIGGISKYLVSFGTVQKPSLYADRIDVGTRVDWILNQIVNRNTTYIATVTAINFAGLQTTVVSRPVTVLNGGSLMYGRIWDGLGDIDIDFQRTGGTLSARWTGVVTQDHGTLDYDTSTWSENGFDYAVGEKGVALNDVLDWTHESVWVSEKTINGLPLISGKTFVVSIRMRNCAGEWTIATTDGVEIDAAPPIPGRVIVGNHTWKHQPYMFLQQHLQARWYGFKDLTSGIASYEWAMSQYHYAPDISGNNGMIMGWHNVGLSTYAQNGTLWSMPHAPTLLTIGSHIYVHVKAIDKIGNFVIETSNATLIAGH